MRGAEEIGITLKEHPFATLLALALTGFTVAANILYPLEFVNGLDSLQKNDTDAAAGYFASFATFLAVAQISPLVQEKILIPLGTELAKKLMQRAVRLSLDLPKDTANRANGDNYEIVNVFGGNMQPMGVGMAFYQISMDMLTGLCNIIALNIIMWIKLGKIASLTTAQSSLFLLASSLLSKPAGEAFGGYIHKGLYRGFSNIIVLANDHVYNVLFNRQNIAVKNFMDFIEKDLIPKTKKTLYTNANFLMIPFILGFFTLIGQLMWAVYKHLLTPDKFILLIFYSLIFTQVASNLTRRIIESLSSYGLLFTVVLEYLGKAVGLPTEEFSLAKYYGGIQNGKPAIQAENVAYTYPNTPTPVFEKVSFTIKPGEIVTITGDNGRGKSSFFNMLFGFANPDAGGKILFAGYNTSQFNQNSVREICAFVPQESKIAVGTFRSNICCRCPDATDENVKWAMRAVGLLDNQTVGAKNYNPDDPIKLSPNDPTKVTLSGGEQKKVMLARALLEIELDKAKLLFLDEFSAGIDKKSLKLILPILFGKIKEKNITTVIITHDLKGLKKFVTPDQVIDMNAFEPKTANSDDIAPVPGGEPSSSGNRYSFHIRAPAGATEIRIDIGDVGLEPIQTGDNKEKDRAPKESPRASPV